METEIELVWLPVARIAALYGKSVKTIRRQIDEGSFIAVRRTVDSGSCRTTKLFVLVGQEVVDLDRQYCRKHGQTPHQLEKELMFFEGHEYSSLFIVSYNKGRNPEVAGGQQ
jgi:hypothetical protein